MISHPEHGAASTATAVAASLSTAITGKIVVITGVSPNSLGEALASALAAHSPGLLILASRTPAKIERVVADILTRHPRVAIASVPLDLADLASVSTAAVRIAQLVRHHAPRAAGIDVLFNNAGISSGPERRVNARGVEMVWATNHLGGFALTGKLVGSVGVRRVVVVSSEAHRGCPVRFGDWNGEGGRVLPGEEEGRFPAGMLSGRGGYEPLIAYAQSKTANVLHVVGLRRRGVESFALHPGDIMTDLVRDLDAEAMANLDKMVAKWKTPDQGAATMVVAGFDPGLLGEDGVYLMDCGYKRPSKWAVDGEKAERLWRLSEELVGERFDLGKKTASHL